MGSPLDRVLPASLALALGLVGCALFTSFDGLSSGGAASPDAGSTTDATAPDAGDEGGVAGQPDAHLWVFGGSHDVDDVVGLVDVFHAPILPDGSLGPWESGTPLPRPRHLAPAVVGQGFVALVGGEGEGNRTPEAVIGAIEGGTVASWVSIGGVPNRIHHSALMRNGELIVVGGFTTSGSPANGIDAAPVTRSTLGSFRSLGTLPNARARAGVAASEKSLYVLGGFNASSAQRDCFRGDFTPDGGIPSVVRDREIPARMDSRAVVHRDHVLLVGGDGMAEVLVFPIEVDGKLGEPTATASLPSDRADFGLVTHGDRLYVVGGRTTNGVTAEVLVADLAPNGTLPGGWRTVQSLPAAVAYHAAAVF